MNVENMSQWGRFFQNGSTGRKPCLLNLSVSSIWREASCRISRVSSTLRSWDWKAGFPRSSLGTRHFGQRFSLQQATRHCSGWSARYAERIGKVSRISPSEQSISTPSIPALMRGWSSSFLQLWNSWCCTADIQAKSQRFLKVFDVCSCQCCQQ